MLIVFTSLVFLSPDTHGLALERSDCPAAAPQFAETFTDQLKENDEQALAELLFLWEQACGKSEPVFRARVLLLIKSGDFPGYIDEEDLFEFAIAYDIRETVHTNDLTDEYFDLYGEYFGFVPIGGIFDQTTRKLASQLISQYTPEDMEYALLTLYRGESREFFRMLKRGNYADTRLAAMYEKRVRTFKRLPEFSVGVGTGIWLPESGLKLIGTKPSVGVFAGIRMHNTDVNVFFNLRFGRTAEPVFINMRDTLISTRIYQGGLWGIEAGHVFVQWKDWRLGLFATAGLDVIDLIEDTQEARRQTFLSSAFSGGVSLQYAINRRLYIKINPGYQWLDHENSKGSPLSGNAWSIKIALSFSENARRSENLQRLGF